MDQASIYGAWKLELGQMCSSFLMHSEGLEFAIFSVLHRLQCGPFGENSDISVSMSSETALLQDIRVAIDARMLDAS